MRLTWISAVICLFMSVLLVQCGGGSEIMESETPSTVVEHTDWPMYRGSYSGTGYSELSDVSTLNVGTLSRAWVYDLNRRNPGSEDRGPNSQVTPIVVDGVMYLPAADRVVAIDPDSGQEIWAHLLDDAMGAPSRRGVAYWPGDGDFDARIIFVTGSHLRALDASTGDPVVEFGDDGAIALGVPYNSVPLVYRHVAVVGANTPRGEIGGIGNARAYDVRTGEMLWEFDSVAQPGDVGHDTWDGDSWRDRLGANAWPFYFTLDEQRGLLYLPLASPIPGAFGGDRLGSILFGNSVVAVDVETGEYRWHFQTIHHDLWDADPPAPPVLFEISSGQAAPIPALGVTTKSGYLYILNRETGEPIFGVEEREVAASDVPGESSYPTQPIPVKPPAVARVQYGPEDLVTALDTTPEHVIACEELVEAHGELYNAGPFTPWVYRNENTLRRSTLLFPGLVGGPNWGGAAFNPRNGYVYVFSQDLGSIGWLEDAEDASPVPYRRVGPRPNTFDVEFEGARLPCQKPPWGRLTAVDSSTGDVAWVRPLGITEQLPDEKKNTGRPGRAGVIVTASGVLFVAATDDNRFRALDATTGEELWVDRLEQRGNANPMTYQGGDGRQYVVIAARDTIEAYRLP